MPPDQVVYQLTLSYESQIELPIYNYLKIVGDIITDFNGFSYFRKLYFVEPDAEIYNDAAGKLGHVKKILTMRMLPILLLFLSATTGFSFSKLPVEEVLFSWGMFLIVI